MRGPNPKREGYWMLECLWIILHFSFGFALQQHKPSETDIEQKKKKSNRRTGKERWATEENDKVEERCLRRHVALLLLLPLALASNLSIAKRYSFFILSFSSFFFFSLSLSLSHSLSFVNSTFRHVPCCCECSPRSEVTTWWKTSPLEAKSPRTKSRFTPGRTLLSVNSPIL